jgi:hypothetical protein
MRIIALSLAATLFAGMSSAQIKLPAPSPAAKVTQSIGLTEVTVDYSRPSMKGRVIFGDLVPYGEVWRTGANASTKITFKDDVTFNGTPIPAGTYSFFTIPGEKMWTVIMNKNTETWGAAGYNKEEDVARFEVRPGRNEKPVETLTFAFKDFESNSANLVMKWENIMISFTIEQDVDRIVQKQIKEQLIDSKEPATAGTYFSAAMYYKDKSMNLEQALTWMNKACEMRPEAFWYTHRKAELLATLGKKKEALAAAQQSLEAAKKNADGDFGYIKLNEDLIKTLK